MKLQFVLTNIASLCPFSYIFLIVPKLTECPRLLPWARMAINALRVSSDVYPSFMPVGQALCPVYEINSHVEGQASCSTDQLNTREGGWMD